MSAIYRVKRGDTLDQVFTFADAAGTPVPLTGCTARLQIRDRTGTAVVSVTSATAALRIEPDLGETDTTGQVYLRVAAATMATLAPGQYDEDLELTFQDGAVVSTDTITLAVNRDITV